MCVREYLCVTQGSTSQEKRDFSTGPGCFLNNGEIPVLMHFLYGLMVAGSLKTMSVTEQFCSVTKRVKTDVTLNQLHKAPFGEADVQGVGKALLLSIDQESLSNPAE